MTAPKLEPCPLEDMIAWLENEEFDVNGSGEWHDGKTYKMRLAIKDALIRARPAPAAIKTAEEWTIEISNAIHGIDEEHRTADEEELDCILEVVNRMVASSAGGWQDIKFAPKDGTRIIIYRKDLPVEIGWFDETDWWNDAEESIKRPLAWKPLPEPPK